jgi:hypothetical protein
MRITKRPIAILALLALTVLLRAQPRRVAGE